MGDGHPAIGEVRYRLGLAYEANGDPTQAREAMRRALEPLPETGAQPQWAEDARTRLARMDDGLP